MTPSLVSACDACDRTPVCPTPARDSSGQQRPVGSLGGGSPFSPMCLRRALPCVTPAREFPLLSRAARRRRNLRRYFIQMKTRTSPPPLALPTAQGTNI